MVLISRNVIETLPEMDCTPKRRKQKCPSFIAVPKDRLKAEIASIVKAEVGLHPPVDQTAASRSIQQNLQAKSRNRKPLATEAMACNVYSLCKRVPQHEGSEHGSGFCLLPKASLDLMVHLAGTGGAATKVGSDQSALQAFASLCGAHGNQTSS